MSNFIIDNAALPALKVNLRPLRPSENAINFGRAEDINALWAALGDTRGYLESALAYGLAQSAARPAVTGFSAQILWLDNSAPPHLHFYDGTTDGDVSALLAGSIGLAGAVGFFGTTPVAEQSIGANITNSLASHGTSRTVPNFTSLATYATDAQAIHDGIYWLADAVISMQAALKTMGLWKT